MQALLREIIGHSDQKLRTILHHCAEYEYTAVDFIAEPVGHLAQVVHRDVVHLGHQRAHAVDLFHAIHETVKIETGDFPAQAGDFLFAGCQIVLKRAQAFSDMFGRSS